MSELGTLNNLECRQDGVWSNDDCQMADEYQDGAMRSFQSAITNLPSHDAVQVSDFAYPELVLQFDPMRANFLRAFEWTSKSRVLEIGCGAGAITRFLAEQGLFIDAIEPRRKWASLAAARNKEFDHVNIISYPFESLNFQSQNYDVILIADLNCVYENLHTDQQSDLDDKLVELLSRYRQLLSKQGQLILSVNNSLGAKYLFGAQDAGKQMSFSGFDPIENNLPETCFTLQRWRNLFGQCEYQSADEYYLFPDLYSTKVLLNKNFVDSDQFAFQHLEGVHTQFKDQNQALDLAETLLYQLASANGYLGDFANSVLFVLKPEQSQQMGKPDFAHLPDFKRQNQFVSIVSKLAGENSINRSPVFDLDDLPNTGIEHQFEASDYYPGIQLSVLWQRSFLSDFSGLKFEQYLLDYFDFLKKLDSGVVAGKNIDAIANNIIVDKHGQYQLIDHEWLETDSKIKSDFIFYRAVVHFSLRNYSSFHQFKWINQIKTVGEFVIHCFKVIGINPSLAKLESFRDRDCEFLKSVMKQSDGYQLSNPLDEPHANQSFVTIVSWRYHNVHYQNQNQQICRAKPSHEFQSLIFNLPELENKIDCFRFYPFLNLQSSTAGYFSIDSIAVKAISNNNFNRNLLELNPSEAINKANLHKGVFYGEQNDHHVFMFNNDNTFLEFNLPAHEFAENESIQIEIRFRLCPSYDYELARYQYGLVEQKFQNELMNKDAQIHHLDEDLEKYRQVKLSRIWRLLEAYRDSFKISGYPKKNLFGKLAHMIKLFKKTD